MAVKDIFGNIVANDLFILFQGLVISVAHFNRDLVADMNKLAEVGVVVGARLIVSEGFCELHRIPLLDFFNGRELIFFYVDDGCIWSAKFVRQRCGGVAGYDCKGRGKMSGKFRIDFV